MQRRSPTCLRADTRAQSTVLAVVLLFGFLILSVTAWQVSVVPAQNEEVEYGHNQQVHEQLQELRSRMVSASAGGRAGTVGIPLGTTYPDRTIYRNPPAPVGQLRTVSGGGVVTLNVSNATPVDGETADYWGSELSYDTALVTYRPGYHEYEGAPTTVLDNTLLYDRYDSTTIVRSPQSLVDGRRLSLLVVSGNVSETRSGITADFSLQVTPTSTSTNTVRVENDSGPVTLTVTSSRPASVWNETLAADGQLDEDGGYVAGVENRTPTPAPTVDGMTIHQVGITLVPNETYSVQATRVHLGTASEPDPASPDPAYVTVVDGDESVVEAGSSRTFTVEIRDAYNNPVPEATVNLTLDGSQGNLTVGGTSQRTVTGLVVGDDGQVTVRYDAPDSVSSRTDVTVNVSLSGDPRSGFDPNAPLNATVGTTVTPGDGGGGGGTGGAFTIDWDRDSTVTVDRTAGTSRTFTARIVEGLSNQPVEFTVNDTYVATIASADGQTNASGAADATFDLHNDGTFIAYVTSGGSGDRLVVEVVSSALSPLVWQTASDWDGATSEQGVVHAGYGDRVDSTVLLGDGPGDAGLVGSWSFDEDTGSTVADASGTGNGGTIQGNPALGRPGIHSSTAFGFDGSDDWVRVPDDSSLELNRTNEVTVSAWVKKSSAQSGWIAITQHSDTSYNLQFTGGNEPAFTIYDGTWNTASGGSALANGEWHHLVGTFDGSTVRMYVDGELTDSTSADYIDDGGGFDIGIGENVDASGRHLDGDIDEVRIYERALSAAEVAELYNGTAPAGSGEFRGELVTDWRSFGSDVDPTTLRLVNASAVVPTGSSGVEVVVESDVNGDGAVDETSGPVSLSNGANDYSVPTGSLSQQSSRYRIQVILDADDPTVTPCFAGTALAAGSGNVTIGTGDCPVAANPPTASFTASPPGPSTRETLTVDGSGSSDPEGSISSYEWEFGDGTTATGATATHSYSTPGTYTVTLTVTDDDGLTDSATRTVTVRPAALLTAVQSTPDALDDADGEFVAVEVDGPTNTSDWVVRDDESGTGATLATFPATTDGRVWFVRNASAFQAQWSVPADVTLVEFQPGDDVGVLANDGEPLELVNTSSGVVVDEFAYDTATTSDGWSYTYGNATGVASREGDGSGWYVDTDAPSDWSDVVETDFFGPAPDASFTYAPSGPYQGDSVTFGASGSTVAGTGSYQWEFDDGTTDTGEALTHTFADNGTYNVTLTVTDGNGDVDVTNQTVTVRNRQPNATFYYRPGEPSPGETVEFTGFATDGDGTITSYEWDFGDGTTATGASVTHSFAGTGVYTVTLTVTDDDGATSTESVYVQVRPPMLVNEYEAGDPQTLQSSDFESGSLAGEGWTAGGGGNGGVQFGSEVSNSGSSGAFHGEGEGYLLSPTVDASGVETLSLSFWLRRGADSFSENPEEGEDMYLLYYNETGSWNTLEVYSGGGTPGEVYEPTISLPGDAKHANLRFAFYQIAGSGSGFDYWHVDDVTVTEGSYVEFVTTGNAVDVGNYSYRVTKEGAGSRTYNLTGSTATAEGVPVPAADTLAVNGNYDWRVELLSTDGRVIDCVAGGSTYQPDCGFEVTSPGPGDVYRRIVDDDTDTASDWEQTTDKSQRSLNPGQTGTFPTVATRTTEVEADFESGSLPTGWTGDSNTAVTTQTSRSGQYALTHSAAAGSVVGPTVNASEANTVTASFWVRRGADTFSNYPEAGEDLVVEYRAADGSWDELDRFAGGGTPGEVLGGTYTLPAAAAHDSLAIRFRQTGGSGGGFDYWHVDDVVIETNGHNSSAASLMPA